MLITLKDISKLANVSTTTVSRVLNGNFQCSSKQTREKILSIAKEYNYVPNAIAKGLVTKKTKTIGLIVPDIINPFFPEVARGVEDGAIACGYSSFFCNTDDKLEKEEKYVKTLEERCIDGIIFASGSICSNNHILGAMNENIPVVLIDRGESEEKYPGVFFDNYKGGFIAARHLLTLGHRNIGYITGPRFLHNDNERIKGFRQAFAQAGVSVDENLIVESDYKIESSEDIAVNMLTSAKITAISTNNDLSAIGVYEAARKLNIKIPEELSVVGFDDIYLSKYIRPKLTTIRQPAYKMGFRASQILIEIIEGRYIKRDEIFEPELIVRESTQSIW